MKLLRTIATHRKTLGIVGPVSAAWGVISSMGNPMLTTGAAIGFGIVQGAIWTLIAAMLLNSLLRWRNRSSRAADVTALIAALGGAMLFGPGLYSALTYLTPESYLGLLMSDDPGGAYIYFMVLNPLMELVLVPLALMLNWTDRKRRVTALVGAVTYYAVRTWTAFYFAPVAMSWQETAGQEPTATQLAEADLWLTLDWPRIVLDLVVCLAFVVTLLRSRTIEPGTPPRSVTV